MVNVPESRQHLVTSLHSSRVAAALEYDMDGKIVLSPLMMYVLWDMEMLRRMKTDSRTLKQTVMKELVEQDFPLARKYQQAGEMLPILMEYHINNKEWRTFLSTDFLSEQQVPICLRRNGIVIAELYTGTGFTWVDDDEYLGYNNICDNWDDYVLNLTRALFDRHCGYRVVFNH